MRLLIAGLLVAGCSGGDDPEPAWTKAEVARIAALTDLGSPPPDPTNRWADDPDAAKLGQALYFDTRLSGSDQFSCATCHDPAQGWSDGRALPKANGRPPRHTPTLWNVAWNWFQFWDGRCDSLWCQALGPIEADKEMDGNRLAIAWLVHDDGQLRADYEGVFGPVPDLTGLPAAGRPGEPAWDDLPPADQDKVLEVFTNLGKAIGAYERRIVSDNSRFDQFAADVAGSDALSDEEQRGLKLYVGRARCHLCHIGPNFTNNQFHNLGLDHQPGMNPDDHGRFDGIVDLWANPFNGLGRWSDDRTDHSETRIGFLATTTEQEGQFKVPTLRNIAETAPYMHGGHFATLEAVVANYNEPHGIPPVGHRDELVHDLGLNAREQAALVAFLHTLTGEALDDALLGPPK